MVIYAKRKFCVVQLNLCCTTQVDFQFVRVVQPKFCAARNKIRVCVNRPTYNPHFKSFVLEAAGSFQNSLVTLCLLCSSNLDQCD
jgi:hypothetical protein